MILSLANAISFHAESTREAWKTCALIRISAQFSRFSNQSSRNSLALWKRWGQQKNKGRQPFLVCLFKIIVLSFKRNADDMQLPLLFFFFFFSLRGNRAKGARLSTDWYYCCLSHKSLSSKERAAWDSTGTIGPHCCICSHNWKY